jgi:cysteine-rich repeat protein
MKLPPALRRLLALALLLATACSTGQVANGADAAPSSDAAVDDLYKKPWDDREPLPDDTGLGTATMCGDGRTDPDEVCDPSDTAAALPMCAELDPALGGGAVGCLPSCLFDVSSCEHQAPDPARCGDGTVDATEECDPMGPAVRCETPAYRDAPARCTADCRVDRTMCVRAARCGNGTTEDGESCDDGNTVRCDGCSEVCLAEPAGLCGPPPDPPPRPPVVTAPATGDILDPRAACRAPATLAAAQAGPELTVPYALHICQRRGALVRPVEEVESVMDRVRAVLRVSSRLALVPTDVRYFEHPSCQFSTSNEAIRAQIVQATTPGVIPIAVVDGLTHDAAARTVAGYAITGRVVFVSEIDRSTGVAAMPRALDEQTLVHELGHFFGLAHTFECRAGRADPAQCGGTGDMICDTPADRGPRGMLGIAACSDGARLDGACATCSGDGTANRRCAAACLDAACGSGDATAPDRRNFMGYYSCTPGRFSAGQGAYMRCVVQRELRAFNHGNSCGDGECEWYEDDRSCPRDCGGGCLRFERDEAPGGPTCGDLALAYTAAGVNVAYYPFTVTRPTRLFSGGPGCVGEGRGGQVFDQLAAGQTFMVQSTRNRRCSNRPLLRGSIAAGSARYRFGYLVNALNPTRAYGWVDIAALGDAPPATGMCNAGLFDEGFQAPYNPRTCQRSMCSGRNTCASANPSGQGDDDCGGARDDARPVRVVNAVVLPVYYAPAYAPKRFLHRGDRVTVLYRNPRGWVFIDAVDRPAPECGAFSNGQGWVEASSLRAPDD